MTYSQGDIILIPFPFTDLSRSKPRPAIVISNAAVNLTGEDIIIAQITSNNRQDDFSFSLEDEDLTVPLRKRSEIRCNKIVTASKAIVLQKISALKKSKQKDLIQRIESFLEVKQVD